MRLTSEQMKLLYQQQSARSLHRSEECLTVEVLIQAVAGELTVANRELVADHLAECSDCTHEYRLARSLTASLEGVSSTTLDEASELSIDQKKTAALHSRSGSEARKPGRPWLLTPATLALSLVILASGTAIVWYAINQKEQPQQAMRGGNRLPATVDPSDQAALSEAPAGLSWSAVESADSYQVILYDSQSKPLWESGPTTTPFVSLPESVRLTIEPGKAVYWRIIVQHGIERDRSELFQFTIQADKR